MKICVQGLWHLGSVTAACMASVGHEVSGLDSDPKIINGLNEGKAPLFEPGLDELILRGMSINNLCFSSNALEAAVDVEVLWVAFDTPVDGEDKADVEFVVRQIESVLSFLSVGTIVLISSQMPVGSIRRLENIADEKFADSCLSFAYSPENLRLGNALDVFLNPDRIVVGIRSERDRLRLEKMFLPITNRIEWMSVESAEMTKHAINAFLATSIAFANEIASVCELVGADAKEVERGLKTENRIGPKAYLSPGGAFAGGTLARDINFLSSVAFEKGLKNPLLGAVKPSNDEHKNWARRRILSKFPDLLGRKIAIWGLTYKPGTDTLRRSLAIELCQWLLEQGAQLRVHDPVVSALPTDWGDLVTKCSSPAEVLMNAEVLVIATEWPLYREQSPENLITSASRLLVVDANRFLEKWTCFGNIEYVSVGSPMEGK